MSGTPGPSYIEFPSHVILEELDVAEPLPPQPLPLGQPGCGRTRGRRGREADPRSQEPDPAGGPRRSHVAHPGGGQGTRRADGLPGDPDLRRHVVHPGAARTAPSPTCSPRPPIEAVEESDLCVALGTELGEPMHYGRTQHWAEQRCEPQMGVRRAGPDRHRRQPAGSTCRWSAICAASCRSSSRRCGTPRAPRRPTSRRWSRPTPPSWRGWPKRPQVDAPRCTRRATWSRRPRRSTSSPRTASWCATVARPSSSSGPTRSPSRAT